MSKKINKNEIIELLNDYSSESDDFYCGDEYENKFYQKRKSK